MTDGPDELASLSDSLDRVEAALSRIDDGTYGACGHCAQAMDEAALVRDPSGSVCSSCSQARIDA